MPEKMDVLAAVYVRNIDAVYRLCYVYLRSRADAEDAAQSVFVRYLQKQRMLCGIQAKHERLRIPPHKTLRITLICAALCTLIGTSAFAAVSFGLMDGLRTFLQPATPEQEELLAQGAYVIDKCDSNPNGTLKVKQVIGDSNLVYLLMEFTAPEGTVLDLDGYRFNGSLDAGQQTTGAGFVKVADDDEGDNRIYLGYV